MFEMMTFIDGFGSTFDTFGGRTGKVGKTCKDERNTVCYLFTEDGRFKKVSKVKDAGEEWWSYTQSTYFGRICHDITLNENVAMITIYDPEDEKTWLRVMRYWWARNAFPSCPKWIFAEQFPGLKHLIELPV